MRSTCSRRSFLVTAGKALGGAAMLGAGSWWYAANYEPNHLKVERVVVPVAGLPPAFDGLTIGQISDLHLGRYVTPEQVRVAVDALLAQHPAVAAVTGDIVSRTNPEVAAQIERELSRLTAPLGAFAILGNHDHWTDAGAVSAALRRAGLTLLRNDSTPITLLGDSLHIAGVDDVWERQADLQRAVRDVPADGRIVLLAHEPDFADHAAQDSRIALQLSGHTHGGQLRVPGIGGIRLPHLGQKYPEGLRRVRDMFVYTNRGIGVVTPPLRFNCPPEVTVLALRATPARP